MKRIISTIVCLIVAICAFGITQKISATKTEASQTGASSGITGDCTWQLDDDGLLTISAKEKPDNYLGESYGRMDDYTDAFYNRMPPWMQATSVVIENGVTYIGSDAFYNCTKIQSINIPDSVTDIGYRAFDRCYALTSTINYQSLFLIRGVGYVIDCQTSSVVPLFVYQSIVISTQLRYSEIP